MRSRILVPDLYHLNRLDTITFLDILRTLNEYIKGESKSPLYTLFIHLEGLDNFQEILLDIYKIFYEMLKVYNNKAHFNSILDFNMLDYLLLRFGYGMNKRNTINFLSKNIKKCFICEGNLSLFDFIFSNSMSLEKALPVWKVAQILFICCKCTNLNKKGKDLKMV